MNDVIMQWLPAVAAVAAWPAGIVLMVLGVLVLVPRSSQVAVLAAIAEVIRAARGKPISGCAPPPAVPAEVPLVQNVSVVGAEPVAADAGRSPQ